MLPLRDKNPTTRAPVVTVLLMVANVAVFLFVQHAGTLTTTEDARFEYEHAAIPCEVVHDRPLTIQEINFGTCSDTPRGTTFATGKNVYLSVLVSMFLHGGWLHIGGNMLFLWIFGNNVEDKLGPIAYLVLYLVAGAVAMGAQIAADPSSTIPVIGASGAIAGVMGAYLVWFPRARVLTLLIVFFIIPVELPAFVLLLGWLVLQFFTGPNSDVAWVAHVGGFAFGALVALAVRNTAWWRRRTRPPLRYTF